VGTDENKTIVRRYLAGMHAAPPDVVVFDELLAPNFQGDRAARKAFASALGSVIREQVFEVVDLVAEGDAVVARFNYQVTVPDGTTTKARGYVHGLLEDGKIVSQDVLTDPDLSPVFAPLMSPPTSD
jgi:ketosteroid isomerase-like protein